ncbi:MAG: tetratricopeptide repeat protein [Gemmataceae bacterium]
MHTGRWPLALLSVAGLTALAAAQGPSFGNPYVGGGLTFSHGRLSVGFGFRGGQGHRWHGPFVNHSSYFSVYAPPPPIIFLSPPPRIIEVPSPPLRVPLAPELPPVPDVPPDPPPPAPKPKEKPKAKPKDDGEPRLPPRPEPLGDAAEEAERQTFLGRQEFAAGQYGRAAGRFRRAMELKPADRQTPFLLVQALLALGKYHDASDALVPALRAAPDWPGAAFRPLDLYGPAVTEYSDHLRLLDETRARHPDDPVLQFLAGYQMWFDGRRGHAVRLFRQAEPRFTDPDAVERFLLAAPPGGPI